MGASSRASIASARTLVALIATVTFGFLLVTVISQVLDRSIARRVDDIVDNAMPSVQLLALARGDMHRVEHDLDHYPIASDDERGALDREIVTAVRNADAAVATYVALPFFPGERDMFEPARRALLAIDGDVDQLRRGDRTVIPRLHAQLDTLDHVLERVVTFDAAQGQRLGLSIAHTRESTTWIVRILDLLLVLLAAAASLLAIRQLRAAAARIENERSNTERRVSELSAQVDELGHFAGRVAHDVLSPLSATQLAFDLVRLQCADRADAVRATERGTAALHRVQALVAALLAFARAGGKPEAGAHVRPADELRDLLEALGRQARTAQIAFVVEPIAPVTVACSAGVFTSIVSNLVRNAIRHMGDARERRVTLRVRDHDEHCRIEVEDTGPGIPPGQERRIFDPYVQLTSGGSGIGLGLATVDRLVRAHSGEVGVVSPPGHGCLFWVELPVGRPIGQDTPVPPSPQ